MPRASQRPALTVTRDNDGGLTVHDSQSGIVLSVIGTNPAANGPKGLFVEAYAYAGGPVTVQAASVASAAIIATPALAIPHPTIAFYSTPEPVDGNPHA